MNATTYLGETGNGPYARWHVPDLAPPSGIARLVFLFESPHLDELKDRLPVVGSAGKSALRFLAPDQPADVSLGRFVRTRHRKGDHRIAIMNVSNVPMQRAAFAEDAAPDLADGGWSLIERVRRSRARSVSSMRGAEAQAISQVLADGLHGRLSEVLGPQSRVVAAGAFSQRMLTAAWPGLTPPPLLVPHPSYNQWHRPANQERPDLLELRDRFGG